jgi:hypothetical protein
VRKTQWLLLPKLTVVEKIVSEVVEIAMMIVHVAAEVAVAVAEVEAVDVVVAAAAAAVVAEMAVAVADVIATEFPANNAISETFSSAGAHVPLGLEITDRRESSRRFFFSLRSMHPAVRPLTMKEWLAAPAETPWGDHGHAGASALETQGDSIRWVATQLL